MRRAAALLLVAAALGGCMSKRQCLPDGAAAAGPPPPDWRDAVSDPDHVKLRAGRQAFLDGLEAARAKGFDRAITAEGRLFDPDYSEDGAALAPGAYRCRTWTLGSTTPGRPPFVAEPPQACDVEAEGATQRFHQHGGPQRLAGRIYPDTPARTVFLGTRVLADEATAIHYGRDADRDAAGAINRIGPNRWRMAIPRPAWQATVEVVEIVPG